MIAARAEDVAALDDERSGMLRAHQAQFDSDIADYERLQRQRKRMDMQRLPLTQQALDLAYRAYAAGSGTLAELLDARRELAATRLAAVNLHAASLAAAAQLYFRYEGGQHD